METDVTLLDGIFGLIDTLISLYIWAIILGAAFSILTSFGVLDSRNRLVWSVGDFLYRVTEPGLRPIRRMLPNFGTVDISPLILILLLDFIAKPLVRTIHVGLVTGYWRFY
jgi:YggT family protein